MSQVIITGDRVHTIPEEVPPPRPAAAATTVPEVRTARPAVPPGITLASFIPAPPPRPASAAGAAAADEADGFPILNPVGEGHALRPYWEYLCFLFR